MNKIYKVIWSKAKHTYVVASEIAKGHTKGETTGKGLKKLAAAMLVAAALLSPSFAWAADGTVTVKDTSDKEQTVYTEEGAKNTFATIENLSTVSTEVQTQATQVKTNATNIIGLTNRVTALENPKTDTALHISSSYDLIVGTKENQIVRDMGIRGELTSGSVSTGDITSTGDVTVAGKMAADGVTDETTKDGTYIKQNNTVGNNLVSLDKQVKANADAVSELDTRITNVKEYVLSETNNNYVSKTDAAVEDGAIVKKANTIGQNVAQLDAALAKETAARLGADAAQDKVIQQVNDNLVASVNTINESVKTTNENMAAGFTALSQTDAAEAAAREAKDNELNERITNEANDIHETTNKLQSDLTTETTAREAAYTELNERITNEANEIHKTTNQLQNDLTTETNERKAADTALDTRITKVKEYLENQTADKYVSKDDAAVQDGAIVKAANTIGDNVTKLDAAQAKETADRLGADAAQDKVIQTVNDNLVSSVNTINKNMADGFKALSQADANELAGRVAADTELVKATNGGLALNDKNVLQKNETTIAGDGTVTTKTTAADTLIMNEGKKNQITLSENGIKVGTGSTVIASDGVFAGGDTANQAKAALNADGSIKGANGDFTVDKDGNVTSKATITGETVTDGKGASMSNGTVTGKTLTDGIATISNGNINTTGTVTGGTVTSTGNISALGDIHAGGAITGASASIQGALTAGSATITGDLTAGGAIQGKSISDGTATMQNGNITGVKNLSAETITTSGNADIGGDLTVKGKLNVDEIDLTKNGIDDDYYVTSSTKVAAGEITAYKDAKRAKDGSEKESGFGYDENGTSTWAQSTDADKNWNKSTLTVEGNDVTSTVVDSNKNKNVSTQTAGASNSSITGTVDGKNYKSYITQNLKNILQGIQNGDNATAVNQTETGIKSTATDGKNTASTNLSNKGFNTYATDGTNKTYTLQTAESLTSQIGDDGKVKSVMNADGITNNADGGTITNSAKDLVNTATGDITNTAKNGTITNDAKDLVNKASGSMTNTVGGKLLNDVTGDMENKVGGNLTTTVEKNMTTTVTGDSSLTAENINNEAKNKIINKALDVETDASSSIVNKVSNEYGSNTSTQLSYETTEEMSQADGKTASYLRGAAEEKSQLTDGDNKTTIDTIAGQTNTNITDGTNTSNSLQKADQAASSITDGTNTTVVDQKAVSIASSITDGTKVNNTNNTVDKSEQLIKTDDTHYYAETKTAGSAVEALKSDGNTIIIGKDAAAATVSSAVTDGATITGISQNAKDINLSAAGGTIAYSAKNISNIATEKLSNSAAEIENTATKSITDKVGKNTSWEMTDGKVVESVKDESGKTNQTTTTAADTYQFVKDGDNTLAKRTSSTNDNLNITDGTNTYTKITTATGNKQTVTDGKETASTNLTKSASNTLIENGTQSVLDHVAADTSYTVMNEKGNGSRRQQTASEILDRVTDGTDTSEVKQTASEVATSAKDISNTATEKITSQIGDGSKVKSEMTADGITNTATKITNITGDNTVTSDTNGTTFENTNKKDTVTFMDEEKSVDTKKTTISGNTITTGEAVMDYADVMKDLGVRGNATIKGDTTMEGNASVGKDLTVAGTSTLTGVVTMENNATVRKNLTVEGDTSLKNTKVDGTLDVTGKSTLKGSLEVTGGTTTDTLHVTSTSQFDGAATFKDIVTMEKDLNVGGNAKVAGDVTAKSFKVGENTYIDENGINANNQVIKNVGQGKISEGSTDAVSGGQLYDTNTRVSGLETRMGTVETKVDKLDNKIDKVGANAAAMANLHPLEFDEDSKWNIAAAVGSSGSETASAVGVFYRPNENVMVNASAAMGTGENMFGGGVSLRLGHGGNKAKDAQMKAAAKENRELRAKVDDLTARMDALLSVLNPNMSKDFPDVPENHWAYEAVSRLAGNGIVEGYEDGKYHGERQMTRYEMAEIIYNALSKGAKAEKKLVEEFRPELQAMAAQKRA